MPALSAMSSWSSCSCVRLLARAVAHVPPRSQSHRFVPCRFPLRSSHAAVSSVAVQTPPKPSRTTDLSSSLSAYDGDRVTAALCARSHASTMYSTLSSTIFPATLSERFTRQRSNHRRRLPALCAVGSPDVLALQASAVDGFLASHHANVTCPAVVLPPSMVGVYSLSA